MDADVNNVSENLQMQVIELQADLVLNRNLTTLL
jgi:hypothetical protein